MLLTRTFSGKTALHDRDIFPLKILHSLLSIVAYVMYTFTFHEMSEYEFVFVFCIAICNDTFNVDE